MELLTLSPILSLFVDRFGRSLQVFQLELDKEAISDIYGFIPRFLSVGGVLYFILKCF